MARFNLITNLTNGAGLQRDYEMLRAELERRGHKVNGIDYRRPYMYQADVNVFLEVIEYMPRDKPQEQVPFAYLAQMAPRQWVVPNPEWWYAQWPLDVWDVVLTKTRDATRIFKAMVGDRCQYLGWQAGDFYDPTIPRELAFLHVAGKSRSKNTNAVIDGARRAGARLTVIAEGHRRVTDEELRHLLNSHAFCLLPSKYEGYGHSLHEAYGCAQVILTTDAAPMNEVRPIIGIRPFQQRMHHAGPMYEVTGKRVAEAIMRAYTLSAWERLDMGQKVRQAFLANRATFHTNLDRLLETHL